MIKYGARGTGLTARVAVCGIVGSLSYEHPLVLCTTFHNAPRADSNQLKRDNCDRKYQIQTSSFEFVSGLFFQPFASQFAK